MYIVDYRSSGLWLGENRFCPVLSLSNKTVVASYCFELYIQRDLVAVTITVVLREMLFS